MNTFLAISPEAVFRIQSKVYCGAFFVKTVNNFLLLTFFAKKHHNKY